MPSSISAALRDVSLDDKYALEHGRVFLTGAQALVRLLILQRQRDVLAGLDTAGFVSGYRGSPLGALDQSLWRAQKFLDRAHIKFQPGLNEDLAREISKRIRTEFKKVNPQIQGDLIRVSGKNRDDLQTVIQALRESEYPVPLQFVNYR